LTRQEPAPRGSPQAPQGAAAGIWAEAERADTAKTECCLSSDALWQSGQAGWREAVTRVSK
jgi:hypothetical protein